MRNEIIELDRKGVLPLIKEDENAFYKRGNKFLEAAYDLKEKSKKKIEQEGLIDFEEHFLTSLDWVSNYYEKIEKDAIGGVRTIFHKGKQIPIIISNKLFSNLPKESEGLLDKKRNLRHELIHVVRTPIEKIKIRDLFPQFFLNKPESTYESFAYSLGLNGYFGPENHRGYFFDSYFIYQKLERIKEKGNFESNPELGYTLLRMTEQDVLDFEKIDGEKKYRKNGLEEYVKDKASEGLRFRIIAERLG